MKRQLSCSLVQSKDGSAPESHQLSLSVDKTTKNRPTSQLFGVFPRHAIPTTSLGKNWKIPILHFCMNHPPKIDPLRTCLCSALQGQGYVTSCQTRPGRHQSFWLAHFSSPPLLCHKWLQIDPLQQARERFWYPRRTLESIPREWRCWLLKIHSNFETKSLWQAQTRERERLSGCHTLRVLTNSGC